jgi:hypothetical protein
MLTKAWVGLNKGKTEQSDEYDQNGQAGIHGLILLLNHRMQIRCPLPKVITH